MSRRSKGNPNIREKGEGLIKEDFLIMSSVPASLREITGPGIKTDVAISNTCGRWTPTRKYLNPLHSHSSLQRPLGLMAKIKDSFLYIISYSAWINTINIMITLHNITRELRAVLARKVVPSFLLYVDVCLPLPHHPSTHSMGRQHRGCFKSINIRLEFHLHHLLGICNTNSW